MAFLTNLSARMSIPVIDILREPNARAHFENLMKFDLFECALESLSYSNSQLRVDDAFDAVYGNGEADVVGSDDGGDIDADDIAGKVNQRPARVAGVNGGVGLEHASESLRLAGGLVRGLNASVQSGNNTH